jgi:hypothetical protein
MRQKTKNREKNQNPDKNPTALPDRTDSVSRIGLERWTLNLLIFVLALAALGAAGCSRCERADPNGTTGVMQRIEVTNGRFERAARPTLPGGDFWLRKGDAIHARWDEYTIYLSKVGANCDNMHFDGDACRRCPFINQNPSDCGGSTFPPGDYLDVDTFSGMISDAPSSSTPFNPTQIELGDYGFNPAQNSTYRLSTTEGQKLDTWATARVFVIDPTTQGVPKLYKAGPLPQPNVTDAVFYKVKVPDNYSENLKIGKIRVKKGVPTTENGQFTLKDGGSLLKPSRIVLMEGFTDGSRVYDNDLTRCYASYPNGTPDTVGNIDLGKCFHDPCPPNATCTSTIVTANPEFQVLSKPQLTWAIEFKPVEGGEVPVLADGEVVAIEFTILSK